jgi:hypothetical protein
MAWDCFIDRHDFQPWPGRPGWEFCLNCSAYRKVIPSSIQNEAYAHARKLYIETGDQDAFRNMLKYVTPDLDYWKIAGDDPDIAWQTPYVDVVAIVDT